MTDGVSSGPGSRRRLPVQFVRVWVVLVVVAAGLELTTRTSYQRVTLAVILLVALIIGIATFRRFGVRRGPLPQQAQQRSTVVGAAIVGVLVVVIGDLGRYAVVPHIGDRGSFWPGIAGFAAGVAVAYPVMWLYLSRRLDRKDVGGRSA